MDEDVSQSSFMVGGSAGGMVVVAVPAVNRGTEVPGGGSLCRWRALIVRLTSVKVLSRLVREAKIQT